MSVSQGHLKRLVRAGCAIPKNFQKSAEFVHQLGLTVYAVSPIIHTYAGHETHNPTTKGETMRKLITIKAQTVAMHNRGQETVIQSTEMTEADAMRLRQEAYKHYPIVWIEYDEEAEGTADTWKTAHEAILNGDWPTARQALDDMAQHGQPDGRHDAMTNLDECEAGRKLLKDSAEYAECIQDRIDWHNAQVEAWVVS